MPEVRSVLIYGGQILGGAAEPRKATFVINFVNKSERKASQKDLQAEIGAMLASTPDIRYWFVKDNGQRDLSLIVAGPDIDAINDTANQLASEMRSIPTIENPISTAELDRPELRITPKRQLAADLGVSTETLSETIRVATLGDVDANLAKFNAGDRLVPIRVELDEAARGDIGRLQDLRVPTGSGGAAPLSALADFVVDHGPTAINRYDRTRRVTIEGDLAGDAALGDAVNAIRALPAAKHLPPGVEIRETGDVEVMGEVFASFAAAIGAGVMMVYALLVLLFGSFLQPITILVSLPLSVGGAIGALLLTHKAISMPVVIGILMLMGIVTKNAIMLVDFAVEEIGRGTPRTRSAGRSRAQARPADHHDDDRHGGGHVPLGARPGRRRRLPLADGDRGDGRPGGFDPAVAGLRSGRLHADRRSRRLIWRVFGRFVGKADEAPHPRPDAGGGRDRPVGAAEPGGSGGADGARGLREPPPPRCARSPSPASRVRMSYLAIASMTADRRCAYPTLR